MFAGSRLLLPVSIICVTFQTDALVLTVPMAR